MRITMVLLIMAAGCTSRSVEISMAMRCVAMHGGLAHDGIDYENARATMAALPPDATRIEMAKSLGLKYERYVLDCLK